MENNLWVALISLILSAFFSGMEIAFVSTNAVEIELLRKNSLSRSRLFQSLINSPSRYIVLILIGNNIALTTYGYAISQLLVPLLTWVPLSPAIELLAETIIATLFILLFAEYLPKALFYRKGYLLLRLFSLPISLFYLLLFPIVLFSEKLSNSLMKCFRSAGGAHHPTQPNKADLSEFLLHVQQDNFHAKECELVQQTEMLRKSLLIEQVQARDIMVPRTRIVAAPVETNLTELRQLFIESGHSRIPIYEKDIDHVLGYFHATLLFNGKHQIKEQVKPILFIPESKSAKELLHILSSTHAGIVMVVDEFGGTAGLITLEDILEYLFGDIEDEHDTHRHCLERKIANDRYLLEGHSRVVLLNKRFNLNLPVHEEHETLAGLLFFVYQKIPMEGESIVVGEYTCRIVKASANTISVVELKKKM